MAGKQRFKQVLRGLDSDLQRRLTTAAVKQAGEVARDIYRLAGNRHVRLAVTGLSRSGKSVFITSLVNQLLESSPGAHDLPRFQVMQQGRFLGAREVLQADSTVATFRYDQQCRELHANPPVWPASTTDISQLRLQLRSRPTGMLDTLLTEFNELTVDIVDYPGEWLVDLPLLEQSFDEWSALMIAQAETPEMAPLSAAWRAFFGEQDLALSCARSVIERAHELFYDYLLAAKEKGYNFLQPGRVLLPGQLAGSPAVTFCPCPLPEQPQPDSCYSQLAERYRMYQRDVIKPFYRNHFARFDCQVVLTDLMFTLERGPAHFADTQRTLNTVLESFNHGRSSLLRRLFRPRIDRILFAATKVDQLNRSQYRNLQLLLAAMLKPTLKRAEYNAVRALTVAVASVRATETVVERGTDGQREFVRGRLAENPFTAPAEELYYPPGAIPAQLPDPRSWKDNPFSFYAFHPPLLDARVGAMPHINMDVALEFLLGDKL